MVNNYLNLQPAIEVAINQLSTEYFVKNKTILILLAQELKYLENCSKIFSIFTKPTTKLQAEKWPTISYLLLEIYKLYTKLQDLKREINVSFYFTYLVIILSNILTTVQTPEFTKAIDLGLEKLKKYYPKNNLANKTKALYLSLILDPRVKEDGLESFLEYGEVVDLKNKLRVKYIRYISFY